MVDFLVHVGEFLQGFAGEYRTANPNHRGTIRASVGHAIK
jgi:hypothetical protein